MDTSKIKAYAPKARRDFIEAVSRRAAKYGITEKAIAPLEEKGDLVVINGEAFPKTTGVQRRKLEQRINTQGFQQVMEAMAYTWFNRFAAIRYMELHGYLDHGYRVLSPSPHRGEGRGEGLIPEIIEHAEHVDLPGLDKDRVIELKLDGTKDEALYRDLLLAQCHALHQAMPFLFEAIDDETELLLPDNLTQTDSLIRDLVTEIPEEDWREVEIIGWLYQFYISEKKDQVIGKVVASEDIPAATQLFTPNWIVQYMVQNSLGAQWLATYPDSKLKEQMDYYIEPAEQTDEVKAQLAAITPSQLNPEELTLIDPASGSGHILVEAYELFKAIYLERGYRQRDVPQLILEKNLFGLDIDERAAQLTGFALMMKGRADDRRLFERGVKLNVMALVDSAGFDAECLTPLLRHSREGGNPESTVLESDLDELKRLFEHATTFGSLIQVPDPLAEKLPALKQLSEATSQDLFVANALKRLAPLVQQAETLAARYDAVVANPPYMGKRGMNVLVKKFAKNHFPNAKSDFYACFIERGYELAKDAGHNAMVTMESWMFLSSFERFRNGVLHQHTMRDLAHFPYDGKQPTVMGINFGVAVMSGKNMHIADYQGHYCCSRYYELNKDGAPLEFPTPNERLNTVATDEFKKIVGSPVAYWVSANLMDLFATEKPISSFADARQGLSTSDNERFLRRWFEVSLSKIGFSCDSKVDSKLSKMSWFPYNKGGVFRKWYGNQELVINWENDGEELREWAAYLNQVGTSMGRLVSQEYYFRPCITWSALSSGGISLRFCGSGFLFDSKGQCLFADSEFVLKELMAFLNSNVAAHILTIVAPTLDYNCGVIGRVPFVGAENAGGPAGCLAEYAREDWNAYERSWDFQSLPLLTASFDPTPTLESSYTVWITQNRDTIAEMKRLEEENNRLFIDAYGLADELTPEVPIEQITLTVNPAYRYGGKLTEEEQWTRFRQDTMEELISYAIGCMMGRYSQDEPGLIYAHSGNEGFDSSRYPTFPADDDGIVPLTDTEWFDDDAANRMVKFISVAWDVANLEENLKYLADNLSPKKSETSRETIRRYLSDSFFKDHLQTYKKRPIYWLFSSGKQKAFQCLVYLHRYNEGTLSRMRMEYVVPLQSKLAARIDQLDGDIASATSTANRNKLQKEKDKLVKQKDELSRFDEKLRHYADQRISLELDDGVKVNYGKFGDLLAEVKAVTGKKG